MGHGEVLKRISMIIQNPNIPVKMASTASVQSWLGQELETRGVDAVVYTRYILSIFQQDSFDLEQDPELCALSKAAPTQSMALPAPFHGHHIKSGLVEGSSGSGIGHTAGGCNCSGSGTGGSCNQHHHHQHQHLNQASSVKKAKGRGRAKTKNQHLRWQTPEDLKKDAVVKCLQSVTEKDCGIEGLVEELCLKLKKVQEEREGSGTPTHSPDTALTQSGNDGASQTERYYEAFPALSEKPTGGSDSKLKGVWKSKTKRNNSTGSISAPCGEREVESLADKSVSASVSRNSSSPLGFQGRQYQRAQSLPSSLSKNRNKSPTFVVPKYQGRKGHRNYGHNHEKGNRRHHQDRDWSNHGTEKYKNAPGWKKVNTFPEWYKESGEGLADLAHFDDGEAAGQRGEVYEEVFSEEKPVNGDNAVGEEEKLEEAVSTMAESLCRSIIEEWDDEKPIQAAEKDEDLLPTEGDVYMIRNGDGLREWYAGSTRTADFDCEVSLAPIAVDGSGHASIWEKNLVPGNPLSADQQEPWENIARSYLPAASSLTSAFPPVAAIITEPDACLTSPQSLQDDSAAEEASDTMSLAEELRVDVDHMHMDSAPISPRNAPIGTGRNPDSLLRICDHTHAHSHSYDPQGAATPSGGGWDNPSEGSHGALHSTPAIPGLPSDQSFTAEEDSLVQGICLSQKEGSLFNISTEAHSLDMNKALWATYENKQPQVQPPKIVTWDEAVFTGFQPLAKTSAFIEGGVYGSPYSSRNNSQFNSCSTSPCNESSIRELWEGPHSREASSACSLECLLSPQPCGQSCSSVQDEQSIIEDSLVDSPKYLCSRSSSRFDFARSDAENSDNSSAHGTETDEMISEDEWVEEAHKDPSKAGTKTKVTSKPNMEALDAKITTVGGNSTSHPNSSAGSQHGSSANSQLGFCASSFGSAKGTVVSQHHPVEWNKQETLSISSDSRTSKTILSRTVTAASANQGFGSSELHFKPIHRDHGLHSAGVSGDSLESTSFKSQRDHSKEKVHFESCTYPQRPANPDDSFISNTWKGPKKSAFASRSFGIEAGETSFGDQKSKPLQDPFPVVSVPHVSAPKHSDRGVVQANPYSSGAGVGAGDPGGGDGGDTWSCYGLRPGMQFGNELPCFPDEDELFLHEGLLVDQPLDHSQEPHVSHRMLGRNRRRGETSVVCKEFLEDRCSSGGLCGYSHDTSRVTCGQWLEGHCQQGALCQFMHGYTSNLSSQSSSRAGSRTGSTTPDDLENAVWEHQRAVIPHGSEWMMPGKEGCGKGPANGSPGGIDRRGGGSVQPRDKGEHLRSRPINISTRNR